MTHAYTVREIDPVVLLEPGGGWDELLGRSSADPLFCSRDWLATWWRYHGADFGLTPLLLEARVADRRVGLAAFAVWRRRLAPALHGVRVELFGNLWRTGETAMSERVGFVVDREFPEAHAALARHVLAREGWAELVVAHTDRDGPTRRALAEAATALRMYWRGVDGMPAYAVNLDTGFEAFVRGLSGKTRRRVYNERKKLAGFGEVVWRVARDPAELDEFFDSLDRVHELRWGWRASAGRRGRMYRDVAEQWCRRGQLSMGQLRVDARVIAATFDLRAGDTQYGIQKAVDAAFSRAVSPGYLLTGYSFEQACAAGIRRVDFLGGEGKNTDYKSKFGAEQTLLECLQVVRHPVLAAMHRLIDRVGRERLARVSRRLSR